ncbi:zinc metallopeptidase [Novibacillus thermophilus]|jgi:Zn-dependent membrane protease YugP|uniref:Peptidase n=1 Tax=Novibacillus thermophilus TaxID=1471761 RepID=A0A1U9K603_9BACL|nr:zinc metallopeptidase [Novibacillus thermophilus]AQS55458.1 peptidase [Novibacillus thermophilus]
MMGLLLLLTFACFGLTIWAQFKVKGNYNQWSKVAASSGLTGAEVARQILDQNGLYDVAVEPVRGVLSDHYDPIKRVVRLSENNYYGSSIAAVSVAAHEVGHAIQHKEQYSMLVLRHRMFPVVNLTSGIAPFLLLAGLFLGFLELFGLGVLFYAGAVAFQLVTLPVEFNASSRAKDILLKNGFIRNQEERGVNKVLGAAAFTYVASTLLALVELLRFVLLFVAATRE